MTAAVRRPLLQYLNECLVAYPGAVVATFLWTLGLSLLPSSLLNHSIDSHPGSFFFGTPVLASFWATAAVGALLSSWRERRVPRGLFGASRAGEWVWVVGAVYIVFGFLTYLPVSHHWARTALYELFVNTDDIGNLATAPFYMGIAYSLTRHVLRVRAERRAVRGGLQAGRSS